MIQKISIKKLVLIVSAIIVIILIILLNARKVHDPNQNIYKTIKNNSTEEQLDKESIKVLYTKSDNDYSVVLIGTLNKSVIYCFMLEGDKVDRVIT
ncbi:MAG: hypothetical protein K0Q73_3789, partial [Paenibacillus sp.]|nr:hypothetical protein [Paenibacillus sp.]